MNMMAVDEERKHLRIWETLPWIVNGTAGAEAASEAQEHVRECTLCRTELARQRWLFTTMNKHERQAPPIERGLEDLMHRIDDEQREPDIRRVRGPWYRRAGAQTGSHRVAVVAYGLAAMVLVEAGALAVLGGRRPPGEQPQQATYRTLSEGAAPAHRATIRLVVDDAMTVGRLHALLESQQLEIVSGPGQNGVYSLAPVADAGDVSAQVAVLRAAPGVRFAEPVADARSAQ
ncbi:hypothetical protein FSO04_44890 [Paraburkholderia madseniana]|uniref:Zinc-finger domain-containing protein n=1 Tax=Paraburkholderia madseniana TaxID=2599607 RepID=A0A6N6VZ47_9BURK|nr:hypothetical protein [Paraburkholderia madseniana]KAE8753496.1 hypothetical protein FSO04_44890 [Paraburkholderia madseniana]